METLPNSAKHDAAREGKTEYPSLTYAVRDGRVSGMTDGLEAMGQAIDVALRTERYRYQIHSPDFGAELSGLVGKPAEYVMSMLKRRITEALKVDRRVTAVEGFAFDRVGEALTCSFEVRTVYGTIRSEVGI